MLITRGMVTAGRDCLRALARQQMGDPQRNPKAAAAAMGNVHRLSGGGWSEAPLEI
jgi:hypothetical protein